MEEGEIVPLISEGDEQIVRIPDSFRLDTAWVRIWKEGTRVIIEPSEKRGWPPGFWERMRALGPLSEDFSVEDDIPAPPPTYRDAVIEEFVEWLNSEADEEKPA